MWVRLTREAGTIVVNGALPDANRNCIGERH